MPPSNDGRTESSSRGWKGLKERKLGERTPLVSGSVGDEIGELVNWPVE